MEIKIKNFNCIEDMDLNFNPGFTILQGPSNSGKSSAIKAIENTIFNQSGTTNVRQGQDNYIVGIKKGDQTVSLIKGKNSKYKVNGQIYEKFGVNQLPEVADALNIRETILGGEKVRLNFSHQMSYPFLLDKTPGQMYRFIVDSSESESLSNVLKDISKDIKDDEKSIIQNDAQLDILIKQQTDLNYKLLHADTVLDLSNQILDLDTTDAKISKMVEYKNNFSNLTTNICKLRDTYNLLDVNLDTSLLDKLKEDYLSYTQYVNKYHEVMASKNSLETKLSSLDIHLDTKTIEDLMNTYNNILTLVDLYKQHIASKTSLNTKLTNLDVDIADEKSKLDNFKICPLCGSEIKC